MQQNKKEKKERSSKPRGKKSKIVLDKKQVLFASACVFAVCVMVLAVAALFPSLKRGGFVAPAEFPRISEEAAAQPEGGSTGTDLPEADESDKTDEIDKIAEEIISPPRPKSPDKDLQNEQGFGFPPAKNGAVLCFVFDDGGQSVFHLKKYLALPFPITVAVLPRLADSATSAELVRQSGNEVILHQPMQAINRAMNPGAGAILPEMSGEEITQTILDNIAEISPVAGINNHEGSLITEDEESMGFVLEAANKSGVYFLDSRTSSQTKIPSVSMEKGYPYYERDVFLDNEKTRANILNEMNRALEIANKKGAAIIIGHIWSAEILPDLLSEMYPELLSKGYRFSTVSKSGAERL